MFLAPTIYACVHVVLIYPLFPVPHLINMKHDHHPHAHGFHASSELPSYDFKLFYESHHDTFDTVKLNSASETSKFSQPGDVQRSSENAARSNRIKTSEAVPRIT